MTAHVRAYTHVHTHKHTNTRTHTCTCAQILFSGRDRVCLAVSSRALQPLPPVATQPPTSSTLPVRLRCAARLPVLSPQMLDLSNVRVISSIMGQSVALEHFDR
jgi:hypothetical protein